MGFVWGGGGYGGGGRGGEGEGGAVVAFLLLLFVRCRFCCLFVLAVALQTINSEQLCLHS